MKYKKIKHGVFLSRPNRFIANVIIDGREEQVHVKNTGRCKELLINGVNVILEESDNPNRKTKYSLVAVYKGENLVNMDSQAPNEVVYEALSKDFIKEIKKPDFIKREASYSKSRFDLYFEKDETKGYIEVKGVTLENNGVAAFPDAPTARGRKHIEELIKAKEEGFDCAIFLLIQMQGVKVFVPNRKTDPDFANILSLAKTKGVKVLCYDCKVFEDGMEIGKRIEIDLEGEL